MAEQYDAVASEIADLDGDGYGESLLVDQNADGVADLVFSDLDGDGVAETAIADTDFDGYADVGAVADAAGNVYEVDLTGSGSGYSGSGYDSGTYDDAYASSASTGAVGPYPAGSDTAAVINDTSSALGDAWTIAQEGLDPGSQDADEVADATERAENRGANAGWQEGYVAGEEARTEAYQSEQTRSDYNAAREEAAETSLEAAKAIWRADDAL